MIDYCLLCGGSVKQVLAMGNTPLANNFTDKPTQQELFPLNVMQCQKCHHVQLDCSVNRKVLFSNYLYVAGTSPVNRKHYQDLAHKVIKKFLLTTGDLVCEIASNDGCLLRNFQEYGINVIGIDPAINIAQKANAEGIPTIANFFGTKLAMKIEREYGKSKVVICNNAFAHNKQIVDLIEGVKIILDRDGSFIFENSYLLDIVEKTLPDIFYHEHISTFSITALLPFLSRRDLDIYEVERIPNHGGSIRVYTCFRGVKPIHQSVNELLELEKGINDKLTLMAQNVNQLGEKLRATLQEYKAQGKSIACYGFPAKATSLCSVLQIDMKMIDYVIEDAELKIGRFTPLGNKEIFGPEEIIKRKPDVLVVLAWNFGPSIIKNVKKRWKEAFDDERYPIFITPLPELKVE